MLVCMFLVCIRTRDRGGSAHPVFPAPSDFEEGKRRCKPRARCVARSQPHIHPSYGIAVIASEAKQSIPRHRENGLFHFARNDEFKSGKKSREPASVFAAAGSGWGSPPSWEETAVR